LAYLGQPLSQLPGLKSPRDADSFSSLSGPKGSALDLLRKELAQEPETVAFKVEMTPPRINPKDQTPDPTPPAEFTPIVVPPTPDDRPKPPGIVGSIRRALQRLSGGGNTRHHLSNTKQEGHTQDLEAASVGELPSQVPERLEPASVNKLPITQCSLAHLNNGKILLLFV
jgi:hypothetical protein